MDELLQKSHDLILTEREYTLKRWGNDFDERHSHDDWCAFAIKELYAHRDGEDKPVYLWPGRTPDLSFMLALTGTASVLLSSLDAWGFAANPVRPDNDKMNSNKGFMKLAVAYAEHMSEPLSAETVSEWLNKLSPGILAAYKSASEMGPEAKSEYIAIHLANILRVLTVVEQAHPGLLDEATIVTKNRLAKVQHHPDAKSAAVPVISG